MDQHLTELIDNLAAYALVAGPALLGALVLFLVAVRGRLLPLARLRPGGWTGFDVFLAWVAFYAVVPVVVSVAVLPFASRADGMTGALRIGVPSAITLLSVLVVPFVVYRHARPREYGLTAARWRSNVVLGVLLFVVVAPPTLGLDYAAVVFWNPLPNPLEVYVKSADFPDWGWGALVSMTVIGAPLLEEILFRGILQGWLRRATLLGHVVFMAVVLALGAQPLLAFDLNAAHGEPLAALAELLPKTRAEAAAPLLFTLALLIVYGIWLRVLWHRYLRDEGNVLAWRPEPNPYEQVDDADEDAEPTLPSLLIPVSDPIRDPATRAWAFANARLAVFGSSLLFALAHTHWPDPIPLLLLGLGLGWLAYRTQSIVGGMVCHALFNVVACIVLRWSV